MKKLFIIFSLLLLCFYTYSQNVGINTDGSSPDVSSMLDIKSSNKGLLIPRVALTSTNDITTISSPATSLLVYNTATVSDVTPGFYYWNGAAWSKITGSAASGWNLTGNAGTSAGTNFIGTTDNQSLDLRTNNTIKVRVTTKGQIEIFNTSSSVLIGEDAGETNTNTGSIFIGYKSGINANSQYNTAIGYRTLENVTIEGNTAIGSYALQALTSGKYNVAVGSDALYLTSTGEKNTAIGVDVLRSNTIVNYNVGVGVDALRNNTTSSRNIAIGNEALLY